MRFLARYFFRGMLFIVPVAATVYVAWSVLRAVDQLVKFPQRWAHVDVPGMGILVAMVLLVTIGYLASHFFTQRLAKQLRHLMERVPLIKLIYGSIRDLVGAFVGDKKSFDRPVLATIGPGVRVFGFVTRDDLAQFGASGHIAVYVPQSYNFAANLIVVPADPVSACVSGFVALSKPFVASSMASSLASGSIVKPVPLLPGAMERVGDFVPTKKPPFPWKDM